MNRRIALSPLAALALAASALAFVPEEPREPPPPERRPPPPKPSSGNALHDHLDVCAQCRDNPFGLCAVGAIALEREARAVSENGFFARMPPPRELLKDEFEWRMSLPSFASFSTRSPAPFVVISHRSNAEEAAIRKRDRKRAARLAKVGAK